MSKPHSLHGQEIFSSQSVRYLARVESDSDCNRERRDVGAGKCEVLWVVPRGYQWGTDGTGRNAQVGQPCRSQEEEWGKSVFGF